MTRCFAPTPLPPGLLEELLDLARRAPSAGFAQGVHFLCLEGPDETRPFHDATCDAAFLEDDAASAGLLRAPAVVVPLADPAAYLERYAAADKARSGLAGLSAAQWPVPYWLVDASFATMALLLAATDAGLGALFYRLHRDPLPYLSLLGVPPGVLPLGAVALGYPAGPQRPGSPRRIPRRSLGAVVHRGRW
jgi:nitroreductase